MESVSIKTEQLIHNFDHLNIDGMGNSYPNSCPLKMNSLFCNYPIVQQKPKKLKQALYAIEIPEIDTRFAVVDRFPSLAEAQCVVMAMEREGLDSNQITIVAKNEHESENSGNWENIYVDDDLSLFLTDLGISDRSIQRFINAVENGDFLVIAIGNDWEASKAQHVFDNIGNWQFNNYFKSIVTLPEQLKKLLINSL